MPDKAQADLVSRFPNLFGAERRYVFISTYGRSGSTLLMKLLNSIPGACIGGENNNALEPILRSVKRVEVNNNFALRREAIGKAEEDRVYYLKDIIGTPSDPWFGAENINPDMYAMSLLDSFVEHMLSPPPGASLLGFKEIRFYQSRQFFKDYMNYILRYFPSSKVIFQTRELDQVTQSGWWRNRDRNEVVSLLEDANKMFRDYADKHPDQCLMFDYSSFSLGYEGVKGIFEFLDCQVEREEVEKILQHKLIHLK